MKNDRHFPALACFDGAVQRVPHELLICHPLV